jgi:hypothetical protein
MSPTSARGDQASIVWTRELRSGRGGNDENPIRYVRGAGAGRVGVSSSPHDATAAIRIVARAQGRNGARLIR